MSLRKLLQDRVSPNPLLHDLPTLSAPKGALVFELNSPFDSSMGVTALVIISALIFLGFFSLYVRRCAQSSHSSDAESEPEPEPLPSPSPTLPTASPPHAPASLPATRRPPSSPDKSMELSLTIESLPLIIYNGEAKDCVICLSELLVGDEVRPLPCCAQVFHPECVDTWLKAHISCPLCRSTNLFGVQGGRLNVTGTSNG